MSQIQSAKQATQQLLERLDESVTYDDIMYEVYLLQKIERGLRDVEDGRVISHGKCIPQVSQWLK